MAMWVSMIKYEEPWLLYLEYFYFFLLLFISLNERYWLNLFFFNDFSHVAGQLHAISFLGGQPGCYYIAAITIYHILTHCIELTLIVFELSCMVDRTLYGLIDYISSDQGFFIDGCRLSRTMGTASQKEAGLPWYSFSLILI